MTPTSLGLCAPVPRPSPAPTGQSGRVDAVLVFALLALPGVCRACTRGALCFVVRCGCSGCACGLRFGVVYSVRRATAGRVRAAACAGKYAMQIDDE